MKRWKYCMAAAAASLIVYMGGVSVYAAEVGTIAGMSEKVYRDKDTDSEVVANVIAGSTFTLLSAETDAAGNAWYCIETDFGIEGYLPAKNVIVAGTENPEPESAEQAETAGGGENTGDEAGGEENGSIETGSAEEDGAGIAGTEDGSAGDSGENGQYGTEEQIQITETINIRSAASTETEIIGKIPQGVTLGCIAVQENEIGETWYEISYNGVHGYIRKSAVTEQPGVIKEAPDTWADGNGSASIEQETVPAQEKAQTQEAFPAVSEETVEPFKNTEEKTENAEALGAEESTETEITDTEAAASGRGFRIDWIAAAAFAGSLLCMAAMACLLRRMARLYRRMR